MKWLWASKHFNSCGGFAFVVLIFASAIVGGCNSEEPAMLNVDENLSIEPVSPQPNYDSREGDMYLYVSAISEDDEKAGRSAGNVSMYRYLGEREGTYRLAILRDDGDQVALAECVRNCKVIKLTWADGAISRVGYNSSSIIGSAFEDAFNGNLVRSKRATIETVSKKPAENTSVIPSAFLGDWDDDTESCETGLGDARLRVEARRLRFYESDAQVERVTVKNDRAITVAASFAGEGETWNDSVTMVLSRSGNQLTIEGLTRHRCR